VPRPAGRVRSPARRQRAAAARRSLAIVPSRGGGDRQQPLAARVVDLERRVGDAEPLAEEPLELAPDAVAVVARMDEHVRREGGEPRSDLPHVEVVHGGDVRVVGERAPDLLDAHPGRRDLEQHAPRVSEQTVGGPQHQGGDGERGDRVRPCEARPEDDGTGGGAEHCPTRDGRRRHEPVDRLVDDQPGEDEQGAAVHLRGQGFGALQPVGEVAGGRPPREPQGGEREADRARVGEHVRRVCQERERVREDARDDLTAHEGEDEAERGRQPPFARVLARAVRVPAAGVRAPACARRLHALKVTAALRPRARWREGPYAAARRDVPAVFRLRLSRSFFLRRRSFAQRLVGLDPRPIAAETLAAASWRSRGYGSARMATTRRRRPPRAAPPPLPPERRTVGQLVAETIRFYGRHFWRSLLLGLGPAVIADAGYFVGFHPWLGAVVSLPLRAGFVWLAPLGLAVPAVVAERIPLRAAFSRGLELARADYAH